MSSIYNFTLRLSRSVAGKTVYLAGPITGKTAYKTHFDLWAKLLAKAGAQAPAFVCNPALLQQGMTARAYMAICLPMMLQCDAVVALPGFKDSKGAMAELHTAAAAGLIVSKALWEKKPMAEGEVIMGEISEPELAFALS